MVRNVEQQQIVDEWKKDIERLANDPLLDRLTDKDQQQRFAGIASQHPGIKDILQIVEIKEEPKRQ
jgi:hypothetical protein